MIVSRFRNNIFRENPKLQEALLYLFKYVYVNNNKVNSNRCIPFNQSAVRKNCQEQHLLRIFFAFITLVKADISFIHLYT